MNHTKTILMFRQMKNIDTAFKQLKLFCILFLLCCTIISIYVLYAAKQTQINASNKIFVLANEKAIEAFASDRKENVPVEARDHIKTFHHLFFSLDPDDKVIQANLSKALYLADRSAKSAYDNLKENGFYTTIISGNISQQLGTDSIYLDLNAQPYYFRYYGQQKIIRPLSVVTRSLVTEGYLRSVARSENNPHGFLIEKWSTLENKDLKVQNR